MQIRSLCYCFLLRPDSENHYLNYDFIGYLFFEPLQPNFVALSQQTRDNNVLIRSGEAPGVGWSRNMLYSGFDILPRSVIRRQTGFAARITRTLSD